MDNNQKGFGLIEIVLIIVVVGVLGATGWYAIHTKHQTDKILSQADKISQETSVIGIKTFDQCQKAAGSKVLQSFPEVCVTKTGHRFINTSQ